MTEPTDTSADSPDSPDSPDIADTATTDSSDLADLEAGRDGPVGESRRRYPTWLIASVGLAIGAGVVIIAMSLSTAHDNTTIRLQKSDASTKSEHAAATKAFLDAWSRYRTAVYSAHLVFERVTPTGQSLRTESTYLQQPPRRAVRQSDSALITAGADSVACNTVGAQMVCAPAPQTDYEGDIAAEIRGWQAAFDGDQPAYRVARSTDGCFELQLNIVMTDPPYGDVARFCFDPTTGALTTRQFVRSTATDTETASAITTDIPVDAFTAPAPTR